MRVRLAGRGVRKGLPRKGLRQRVGVALVRARQGLEARGADGLSLLLVALVGVIGYLQIIPNVPMVGLLLAVVFYEFQKRLDQGLPLMQVAALLAVLQWTVGPMLSFSTGLVEGRYSMYVGEETYFAYALPGTAIYVLGLLGVGSAVRQREMLRFVKTEPYVVIGLVLNGIALVARSVADLVPGGLAFAVHLVSQVGYVGAIYFLFSRSEYRWLLVVLSMLPLVVTSAESAMFHDVILWSGLLFCFWFGLRRHDLLVKLALLGVTGWAMFTIQAIKQEYRAKVWGGQDASLIEQVVVFWTSAEAATRSEVLSNVIVRLNQGWIVSAVMARVPAEEPYAEGETLRDAVVAALVPRVVMENKAVAGGKVNFRRFTGLPLEESTSMAISPLGEAYANFGPQGGVGLMLGFGVAFAVFYAWCLRWALRHPTFLFWIPLIFYQAIKAETEFVTVLNQLSKGLFLALVLHWVIDVKWVSAWWERRMRRPVKKRIRWVRGREEVGVGGGVAGVGAEGGEGVVGVEAGDVMVVDPARVPRGWHE